MVLRMIRTRDLRHVGTALAAMSIALATVAQSSDIAKADELHSYLSDRRDNMVIRANLLGIIVGGGLQATSSGLQLSSKLAKPASVAGLVGCVAAAGFGLMGIHAQNGKTEVFDFDSNMLASFFDRPALPNSMYPPVVWTLLNQISEDHPADGTRKGQLLQLWVRVKRIDSLARTEKIDHLTRQPSRLLKLSIHDLEDPAAILDSLPASPPLDAGSPVTVPKTEPSSREATLCGEEDTTEG